MKIYDYCIRNGRLALVTWLDKKLKVNDQVTLKDALDADQWWTIVAVYGEANKEDIKHKWSNDRLEKVERYIKTSKK